MVNFGAAVQKVLRRFAFASMPVDRTQAEIQRYHTGLGAEFGQPLTYEAITFAVRREPIAYLLTFHVADDVFDNWFEVEPLEEGIEKEKFNEQVQKVLLLLNAKDAGEFRLRIDSVACNCSLDCGRLLLLWDGARSFCEY